jgi:integrase/recombinase XerD
MQDNWSLIDGEGREKYLSGEEIPRVLKASEALRPPQRCYVLTLYYTGARRSEALSLRRRDIDTAKGRVAIKTLKQRNEKSKPVWRRVPVPPEYLQIMDLVFDLKRGNGDERLWKVTERQATRWVKTVMEAAGVPHHSPHTLRHTFGILAAMRGIPLPSIQKWLGHSHSTTTSIYTTAGGAEEDELVRRMWE